MAADYVGPTPQAARLVALAALRPGERVLDAGCGPGTATVIAAEGVGPGGAVVAVDVAEDMLARARAGCRTGPASAGAGGGGDRGRADRAALRLARRGVGVAVSPQRSAVPGSVAGVCPAGPA